MNAIRNIVTTFTIAFALCFLHATAFAKEQVTYGSHGYWLCVYSWSCYAGTDYEKYWVGVYGGTVPSDTDVEVVYSSDSGVNERTTDLLNLITLASHEGHYLPQGNQVIEILASASSGGYSRAEVRNLLNSLWQ